MIVTNLIALLVVFHGALDLFAATGHGPQNNGILALAEASSTIHRLSQTRHRHQQHTNSTGQPTDNSSRFARMMVADNPKDIDALVSFFSITHTSYKTRETFVSKRPTV